MSFVGSMLSNSKGAGFQGQSGTILNPVTTDQATTSYNQAQQGLSQQQQFLQALQGQNGITNQSNVYNQLQGVANGTGPNPAQAQLAQATSANTANQAALMAGQRGSSANTGLIARQAAQQGAANQQNAAGQAATLQAQQSLNALSAQGSLAGQQVANQAAATQGYSQAAQGEQQNILGGIAAQNNANVGMQSNINSANAGIAGINAQGQQQILGGALSGAGAAAGLAKGGAVPGYANGSYVDPNDQTAPPAQWSNSEATVMPQIAGPSQSQLSAPMPAPATPAPAQAAPKSKSGPMSSAGQFLAGNPNGNSSQQSGAFSGGKAIGSGIGAGIKGIFGGGQSPQSGASNLQNYINNIPNQEIATSDESVPGSEAAGSTDIPSSADMGEAASQGGPMGAISSLAPLLMLAAARGGQIPMKPMDKSKPAKNLKGGGKVPGKAKHKGDTLKNDTVPAMLSPQEIVIPRSIATHPNAPTLAAKFVAATLAKQGLKR